MHWSLRELVSRRTQSFFKNFWRTSVFLWGPSFGLLVMSALLSKPGWSSCLCASLSACNGFLRFTSGATPADHFMTSMAAEPFWSTYLHTCIQTLVRLKPRIQYIVCRCAAERVMPGRIAQHNLNSLKIIHTKSLFAGWEELWKIILHLSSSMWRLIFVHQ